MEFKRKSDIKDAIKARITIDSRQAIKAMLRLYEYQTVDEKSAGVTTHSNGVGFTGSDAEILTSFSKQVLSHGYLSTKQVAFLMKSIGKYAGQLARNAIERGLYVKQNSMWVVA